MHCNFGVNRNFEFVQFREEETVDLDSTGEEWQPEFPQIVPSCSGPHGKVIMAVAELEWFSRGASILLYYIAMQGRMNSNVWNIVYV